MLSAREESNLLKTLYRCALHRTQTRRSSKEGADIATDGDNRISYCMYCVTKYECGVDVSAYPYVGLSRQFSESRSLGPLRPNLPVYY